MANVILWHTFESDLVETVTRKLSALLTSPPGGFSDSVKTLHIRPLKRHPLGFMETQHLRLLSSLPENRLMKFSSGATVDKTTVGQLVNKQANLKHLACAMYENNERCGPPDVCFVKGKFGLSRTLVVRPVPG